MLLIRRDAALSTCLPSAVFLLFLLMNGNVPGLGSSESTALLLITLSSSFFLISSAVAAAASSSSSSSWSEYWLKASTSSLKISSLIKPPSGTEITSTQIQIRNQRFSDVKKETYWQNIDYTHLCPHGHHRNYQWVPPGRPRPVPARHRPCMGCCEGKSHLRPTSRAKRTIHKEQMEHPKRSLEIVEITPVTPEKRAKILTQFMSGCWNMQKYWNYRIKRRWFDGFYHRTRQP